MAITLDEMKKYLRVDFTDDDALIEKLMTGPEAFVGTDPVDAFCGVWDTRL